MVIQDLKNQKFGRLLVLSRTSNDKHGKAQWCCQCECGANRIVLGYLLRVGKTKSCGCLRQETAALTASTRKSPRRRTDPNRVEKICPGCKECKPVAEFGSNRSSADGLTSYCRPCHNRITREGKIKKWGSTRHHHLMRKYGISAAEADALLDNQGGVCGICQKVPSSELRVPWHVDHDHSTGKVRGILCHSCNTGLGNFNDNPEVLKSALRYLAI